MSKKGFLRALPIIFICTFIGVLTTYLLWCGQNKYVLTISHDSGVYSESFSLKINSIAPGEIYYTLDGSIPSKDNESAILYDKPIEIEYSDEDAVYSIQMCCFFNDGEQSPVYKKEYILEPAGVGRYQTSYIVSVTGDENALWGYDEGVFVRGRQFDEYMALNPDVDTNSVVIPANYNSDKEVPVHVSIFTKDGEEIISKNCGLRIYGNVTRAKNQKSFRLYARDSYDGNNEFSYELLPNLISQETGLPIREFQRISLHNSGNDNGYAFNRTALVGRLADEFGFPDVLVSETAVVYVNGRYQGFYWLQNTYDDKYFKEKYGDYSGEMVVCEGEMDELRSGAPEKEIYDSEYNEFCNWLLNCDINLDENWYRACQTIDIENFAKYVAIEYYIGNIDWPGNNVKVYRYVSEEDYKENSVFDGRYRYLLFDTDYGMGLKFLGWFGYDEYTERLQGLCDINGNSGIFAKLMERKEFKDLFVNYVLVLAEQTFSLENVQTVLSEMRMEKDAELHYMYEQTDLMKNSLWESDDNSFAQIETEYQEILGYAERRPQLARKEMQEILGCGNTIEISLSMEEQIGTFQICGIDVGKQYTGHVFENNPLTMECQLPMGYSVVGYYVNGEFVEGNTLEIDVKQWIGVTDFLAIEPVVMTSSIEKLGIKGYDTSGPEDCIILCNEGSVELLLSNYAISDSMETAKGRLPNVNLKPGECFYIYGKKYTGEMQDNSLQVSFSWNDEEPVVLSKDSDGIIEKR